MQIKREHFSISTDNTRLDRDYIYYWLSEKSYWAQGRPRAIVERSLDESLCFGLYDESQNGKQIGLARIVTDHATFAWLCDVFVDEAYRENGLGKWLIEAVTNYPDLIHIRRMLLATADAHGLYNQYGFEPLSDPTRVMARNQPPRQA